MAMSHKQRWNKDRSQQRKSDAAVVPRDDFKMFQDDENTRRIGEHVFRIEMESGREDVVTVTMVECQTKHKFVSKIRGDDIGLRGISGDRLIEFLKAAFFGGSQDLVCKVGFIPGDIENTEGGQRLCESFSASYASGDSLGVEIEVVNQWQSQIFFFSCKWSEMRQTDRMEEMIKDLQRVVASQQEIIQQQQQQQQEQQQREEKYIFGRWSVSSIYSPMRWDTTLDNPGRCIKLSSNNSTLAFSMAGVYRITLQTESYGSDRLSFIVTQGRNGSVQQYNSQVQTNYYAPHTMIRVVRLSPKSTLQVQKSSTSTNGCGQEYHQLLVERVSS